MEKIEGKEKSLRELLQSKKYTLHYYQREYRWQRKHVQEMLEDLTTEFLANYRPEHKREDVKKYGVYFMGSIVLAGDENAIIDGQQRLSSLTLLLIYLNNRKAYKIIDPMIFSEAFGTTSFNINVPERQACMTAIYKKENLDAFDKTNASESVKNLCARYKDIQEIFPTNITDEMIPYFCDWLTEKVFFMQILAATEQDAHKIFVTMNDRGLNLTPTEMLKGYLMSEIADNTKRNELNNRWKQTILELREEDKNGEEIFIKAWLRAQYAESNDFDAISGTFHKWVQDNHNRLNINNGADKERFMEAFFYFVRVYFVIRKAENEFKDETKYIYYNAQVNLTLQPLFLMAPICQNDDDKIITQKINFAARFIDLWINFRVANGSSLHYKDIQGYIFRIANSIRRCSIDDLKTKLKNHYNSLNYNADVEIQNLKLNRTNKRYIRNILARITSFIEEQTSGNPHYVEYMTTTTDPFEIEHVLCDKFERFKNEFYDEDEFKGYRNSIGSLLLLRKSINSSLSDSDYDKKLVKYCSTDGNIYAASLGKQTYQNNPRFKNFIAENHLSFEPFDTFGKAEIEKRTRLVVELVNLIWNTEEFQ